MIRRRPAGRVLSEGEPSTSGGSVSEEDPGGLIHFNRPPAVEVRGGDNVLSLKAWTACWGSGCFDGMPPQDPPHIGDPAEILVVFSAPGWEFSAMVNPVGEECGRHQTEPLEIVDATTHRLMPIGFADEYEVTLFGRGPGGDLFVSFRWSTPTDGVMPVPEATASILADHDGQIDSYGVEVPVWNLAATPETVSGQMTITSAEGDRHTFQLIRQDHECSEGRLYLTAPADEGLAAARLGAPPFSYELTLELDGRTHVGTGVWPDDVDPECAPCVPLTFTPPLPALTATSTEDVQPVQIDDVWVFHHDPTGLVLTALHGGIAEIKDECLYVDDTIVVWHVDQLDQATQVIADVKAGEQPDLLIGGGGISLDEGASPEDIPAVITKRCTTAAVWFAAPDSN